MFFIKVQKTCFFYIFYVFVLFNHVVFFVVVKNKNVQNYKYDAFLMGKDSISWTERVFCSSIIDFI